MDGTVLLVSLMLAQPPPAIKLICFLEPVDRSGDLAVRIENPSPSVADVLVEVELRLEPTGHPEYRDPLVPSLSYRAGLDLSGPTVVPGPSPTRLEIPANGSKAWRVNPIDLPWHKKISATRAVDGAFKSVVPPGKYQLDLLLQHPESGSWSSRAVDATVDARGVLALQAPLEK